MNLGAQKVKAWRKSQQPKVAQAEMPARFGLSQVMWSRIEQGHRRPPLDVAIKLQRAGVCDAQDWFREAQQEAA
jgi:transcriptional regulator with XRE-family HTH domain